MNRVRHRVSVIGVPVDILDWETAIGSIAGWGRAGESRYVCFSNVHSVVTAAFDSSFHQVIAGSDMCTSDGAPVTWMLRQLGAPQQERLNGPDLMWRYFAAEAPKGGKVKAYAVTSPKRLTTPALSKLPTLDEAGLKGFNVGARCCST